MTNLKKYKNAAVLGFGLEGKDVAKFLIRNNVQITVFDQKDEKDLDFSGIDKKKVKIISGENYLSGGFSDFDVIFRSPGVYRYIPELIKAEKDGVEISSAIKLFFDLCPAKIIGVTGTKGKGTTSTLIYEILKASRKDVYLSGNIGKPYLELLPKLNNKSWVVMELSSFQLIDLAKSPDLAVVLNITVDHLDWHKNRKEYVAAKQNIVLHQNNKDLAVVNYDYSTARKFARLTQAEVVYFSRFGKPNTGSFIENGKIVINDGKKKVIIGDVRKLLLRGEHNWENVNAAVAAMYFSGIDIENIKDTVFSFKGLEHRLELVRTYQGVSFYNDSFSTNPQPTMAAVDSFSEPITLILGGSDKRLSYDEMGKYIATRKNINSVILIGQIANQIEHSIKKYSRKIRLYNLRMTTMEKVVTLAFKNTPRGGVVLLSPATASFGMFKDYKDRGEQFKDIIKELDL